MKRHGRVTKSHLITTEWSHIYISKHYRWNMMIEAEWEDLWQTKSPHDNFTHFSRYFNLNLYETLFLFNEGEIKVIGINPHPCHDKNFSDSMFSITVLWVWSAVGVNIPVIFLAKGTLVHAKIRGTKLVTRYVLLKLSCVITNKS